MIGTARKGAGEVASEKVAHLLTDQVRADLDRMLLVDAGLGMTRLEWLVNPAKDASASAVASLASSASTVGRGHPDQGQNAFPGSPGSAYDPSAVAAAVDRYLESVRAATTRASYAETLAHLVAIAGASRSADALTPEDYATVMRRWDGAAAATWNRHLSALTSFTAWAQRQELLATNPARRLERRKPARRGDRFIPRARLEALFTDDRHALRERVLWRLLYETAGRAEEILSLSIEDLDTEFRRARVVSKGGAIEYVHWQTGTGRLLPRLLVGRTSGLVFLSGRRAPTFGPPAPAAADIDPGTGRRRLSYPRAEYLFKTATARIDPHGRGRTLHQLRHSALQHLAQAGRTAPELQAKSRHQHLPASGTTYASARRPPPASPPSTTPPPAADAEEDRGPRAEPRPIAGFRFEGGSSSACGAVRPQERAYSGGG